MTLQSKSWNELLLELARIAKQNKSSRRVIIAYLKSYNRHLQRKRLDPFIPNGQATHHIPKFIISDNSEVI